jgi:hypothetical protein
MNQISAVSYWTQHVGIIGMNTISMIGLICFLMRLEMARLGLEIGHMAPECCKYAFMNPFYPNVTSPDPQPPPHMTPRSKVPKYVRSVFLGD